MSSSNDIFEFADENSENSNTKLTWKILVIDDDEGVHSMTRAALSGMNVCGKSLEIYDAYSAEEAVEILKNHNNIVLALVDVVMETATAGLDLVNTIRHELHNDMIRLIIRTGQPGEAPEQSVIDNYDINDYKEKTELTVEKLYTTLRTSIRQYEQLVALNEKYDEFYNKMMYHPLTKLPNRMKLIETLDQPNAMNLILINIQNFSAINASLSYEEGDKVLKYIATYLQNEYSKDTQVMKLFHLEAFHLEGDHFALINYEVIDKSCVDTIRLDIQNKIFECFNLKLEISVEIGAVFEENGNLIQKAEIALHEGRKDSSSHVKVFKNRC
jgi:GGDEF domain-containing protein